MRSMVEGPTLATIHNEPQSCIQILQDIARSNSQRLKSQIHKCGVRPFIALRSVAHAVRFAVDFDRQTTVKASEVHHITIDRKLPSEPQPARSGSELLPEQDLRQCHLAAQLASKLHIIGGSSNRPVTDSR